jgi:hypothetical protein
MKVSGLRPIANSFEHFYRFIHFLLIQMTHERDLFGGDRLIEFLKKRASFIRDADRNKPAVFLGAIACQQVPPFKPVEQSRDVGIARDHSGADVFARHTRVSGPAKDAEDVVLRGRQSERAQHISYFLHHDIGRALDVEENFLFQVAEGLRLLKLLENSPSHGLMLARWSVQGLPRFMTNSARTAS